MTYSIKSKQNAVIYNHLEAYCRENESRPLNFNACSALKKKKKIEEGGGHIGSEAVLLKPFCTPSN